MEIAESQLREDLRTGPFALGEARDRWSVYSLTFPWLIIQINAPARGQSAQQFFVRLECSGYPVQAPTGAFWNPKINAPLPVAQWPRRDDDAVTRVFRIDWQGGAALYLPCDRSALANHDAWINSPYYWRAGSEISLYVQTIYYHLHSKHYVGAAAA